MRPRVAPIIVRLGAGTPRGLDGIMALLTNTGRTITDVARANLVALDMHPPGNGYADGLTSYALEMPREVHVALFTNVPYSDLLACGEKALQEGALDAARIVFAAAGAVERLLALAECCLEHSCREIARRALQNIIDAHDRS